MRKPKFTDEQRRQMVDMVLSGMRQAEVACIFKCSQATITNAFQRLRPELIKRRGTYANAGMPRFPDQMLTHYADQSYTYHWEPRKIEVPEPPVAHSDFIKPLTRERLMAGR